MRATERRRLRNYLLGPINAGSLDWRSYSSPFEEQELVKRVAFKHVRLVSSALLALRSAQRGGGGGADAWAQGNGTCSVAVVVDCGSRRVEVALCRGGKLVKAVDLDRAASENHFSSVYNIYSVADAVRGLVRAAGVVPEPSGPSATESTPQLRLLVVGGRALELGPLIETALQGEGYSVIIPATRLEATHAVAEGARLAVAPLVAQRVVVLGSASE